MFLDFVVIVFYLLVFSYYLLLCTKYQGKFLVRENLLGNKPDFDSDSDNRLLERNIVCCCNTVCVAYCISAIHFRNITTSKQSVKPKSFQKLKTGANYCYNLSVNACMCENAQ